MKSKIFIGTVASNLALKILTGHDVYVPTSVALFQWVWRTIMSSIFHC